MKKGEHEVEVVSEKKKNLEENSRGDSEMWVGGGGWSTGAPSREHTEKHVKDI